MINKFIGMNASQHIRNHPGDATPAIALMRNTIAWNKEHIVTGTTN